MLPYMKKMSSAIAAKIVQMYNSNLPATKIAKKFNISTTPIYGILNENNVKIRSMSESHRTYTINQDYFDNIDTHEKAYFLGFLYADGYNQTEKGTVYLTIHEKDRHILESFKDELKFNKDLRPRINKMLSLIISNTQISKKLSSIGMVKAKTFKVEFPLIDEQYYNSFILGVFDGDGCISINKKLKRGVFSICGYRPFMESISKIINNELKIVFGTSVRWPNRKNNIISINKCGNNQIIKLMDWLYKDSRLYLKRKKEKYNFLRNLVEARLSKRIIKIDEIKEAKQQRLLNSKIKKQNILDKYLKGFSMNEIQNMCQTNKLTIKKILNENNIQVRDKSFYEEKRLEKIKEYWKLTS